MDRKQAIEALRNDIIDACGELTFEGLLLARNLVRSLVEQQESGCQRVLTHSDVLPKAPTLAPALAKTGVQRPTDPPDAAANDKTRG
jgi:hypothetical protein